MQSYLQYRRFGIRVGKQYDRDLEKAAALRRGNEAPQIPEETFVSFSPDHDSAEIEDVEKHAEPQPQQPTEDPNTVAAPERYDEEGMLAPAESIHTSEDSDSISGASQVETVGSIGTTLGLTLTGIHVRDRTTHEGKEGKVFVVGYEGEHDDMNPHNWSKLRRVFPTFMIACIGWVVGFASSIDSAAIKQASAAFGVSEVTESLATGLFLIGFGCGALVAGPISETVGRNPVYIVTLTLYMIFIMASGLAPKIGAQLAFRFIAGVFGSTPLTCAGGSISDLWRPLERVNAFPLFANFAFMGPLFGPVVGGFIGESNAVSWRWVEWTTLIMSGVVLGLVVLFQPETYPPILLKWKASHLRKITGDDRYRAEVEIRASTFLRRLKLALYRPFVLTAQEPIIILIALYLTVIYIILFTFLDGYSFIFAETYGFSEGLTGLSFLGIGVGLCLASCLVPMIYKWAKRDLHRIKEEGGDRLPPEFRLWYAMLGAWAIPVSMFWMGWTNYPWISPWSGLGASALFGYGILCVFISSYQYIIDAYEQFAASALASVTLIRYCAAGGMVVVGFPMYENLGVHWTSTVLGCLSALLVPVPYAFYKWGPRIRAMSKYAKA